MNVLITYSWGIENRMTGVELPDATLNTMTHDGDGKRRRYEDSGGARIFASDRHNIVRQPDLGN